MKREIERINQLEFTLSQKEKQIVVRGREMEKYQKEVENYYLEN